MAYTSMNFADAEELANGYENVGSRLDRIRRDMTVPWVQAHAALGRSTWQPAGSFALLVDVAGALRDDGTDIQWRITFLRNADARSLGEGRFSGDVPERNPDLQALDASDLAAAATEPDSREEALYEAWIRSYEDPDFATDFVNELGAEGLADILAETDVDATYQTVVTPLSVIAGIAQQNGGAEAAFDRLIEGVGTTHLDMFESDFDGMAPGFAQPTLWLLMLEGGFEPDFVQRVLTAFEDGAWAFVTRPASIDHQHATEFTAFVTHVLTNNIDAAPTWLDRRPDWLEHIATSYYFDPDLPIEFFGTLLLGTGPAGQPSINPQNRRYLEQLVALADSGTNFSDEARQALASIVAVNPSLLFDGSVAPQKVTPFLAQLMENEDAVAILAFGFSAYMADYVGDDVVASIVRDPDFRWEDLDGRVHAELSAMWDYFTDAMASAGAEVDSGLLSALIVTGFKVGLKVAGFGGPGSVVATFLFGVVVDAVIDANRSGERIDVNDIVRELETIQGYTLGPVGFMVIGQFTASEEVRDRYGIDLSDLEDDYVRPGPKGRGTRPGNHPFIEDGVIIPPDAGASLEVQQDFARWIETVVFERYPEFGELVYDANQEILDGLTDSIPNG